MPFPRAQPSPDGPLSPAASLGNGIAIVGEGMAVVTRSVAQGVKDVVADSIPEPTAPKKAAEMPGVMAFLPDGYDITPNITSDWHPGVEGYVPRLGGQCQWQRANEQQVQRWEQQTHVPTYSKAAPSSHWPAPEYHYPNQSGTAQPENVAPVYPEYHYPSRSPTPTEDDAPMYVARSMWSEVHDRTHPEGGLFAQPQAAAPRHGRYVPIHW